MKTVIIFLLTAVACIPASAQEPLVEIVYGPLDGDHAGTIYADTNETIDVEVWFRTAPGVSIIGFHLPLSSNDNYIASRNGGSLFYPTDDNYAWMFLDPNEDPNNEGYTNQGFLWYNLYWPNYEGGIHTEGEWRLIFAFSMTTTSEAEFDIPNCDAFLEGTHPVNGGPVLVNYPAEEMDPSQYTVNYACLQIGDPPCNDFYIPGDFNGSGQFNVADIIESFSFLATGSPRAGFVCECPPGSGNGWAVAMDVNNSCVFNIADVVTAYHRLERGTPEFEPCDQCPPARR